MSRGVSLWPLAHPNQPSRARRPLAPLVAVAPNAYVHIMTQTLAREDIVLMTPAAAARVRAIGEKLGKTAQLRLSVEGGGCSGFSYKFGLADSVDADDVVTSTDGVDLVIDSVSLDLLKGSQVDFIDSLGGSSFQVTNPNATAGCGCGSSFSV